MENEYKIENVAFDDSINKYDFVVLMRHWMKTKCLTETVASMVSNAMNSIAVLIDFSLFFSSSSKW